MVASTASTETTNRRSARIILAARPIMASRRADCIRFAANQESGAVSVSKLPASSAPGLHDSACPSA
jgi:hypothetical protein